MLNLLVTPAILIQGYVITSDTAVTCEIPLWSKTFKPYGKVREVPAVCDQRLQKKQ